MVDINAIHDISITGPTNPVKPQAKPNSSSQQAPPVKPVKGSSDTIDTATVERISSDIREVLSNINVKLQLEVDNETGRVIVKVVDPETNEVIKQIPSKEMLRIGKRVAKLLSSYSLNKQRPVVSIFKDSKDTKVE